MLQCLDSCVWLSSLTCVWPCQVKEELLVEALTKRKTVTVNDKLILPYSHSEVRSRLENFSVTSHSSDRVQLNTYICFFQFNGGTLNLLMKSHLSSSSFSHQAITARDSMAKSLYSALFDWIVLRINHALLNKKDMEESVPVRHKHL